jgi:hypothetical protein
MKKVFCLSLIIISLFSINLNAQSAKENYTKEAIYLRSKLLTPQYVKNGKGYRMSLFNDNLQNEMKVSKEAFAEYNKFKSNRNTSLILAGTGLVAMFGGVFYSASVKDARYTKTDNIIIGTSFILGTILTYTSVYYTIKSSNNLHKSIWLRNRDILEL